jgi:LmbE family N-acetylglucosaminyl deacetylase
VEVHLLCATRGEAGKNHQLRTKNLELRTEGDKDTSDGVRRHSSEVEESEKIADIREKELLKSAKILGIKKVEFLDFIDGTLCNAIYHKLADKIIKKINKFKPQVVLTVERRGVSGHLDHIAVSMITTYSYLKTKVANKLYYHCLPIEVRDKRMEDYFIYFPEGYSREEITTRIDYSCCWKQKVEAMMAHQSQIKDVRQLVARFQKWPKVDHFILQYHQGIKIKFPEADLFAGIDN